MDYPRTTESALRCTHRLPVLIDLGMDRTGTPEYSLDTRCVMLGAMGTTGVVKTVLVHPEVCRMCPHWCEAEFDIPSFMTDLVKGI